MAEKLLTYFDKAKAKSGLPGKIKLAMITKISSQDAGKIPDSPENIALFEKALAQL